MLYTKRNPKYSRIRLLNCLIFVYYFGHVEYFIYGLCAKIFIAHNYYDIVTNTATVRVTFFLFSLAPTLLFSEPLVITL